MRSVGAKSKFSVAVLALSLAGTVFIQSLEGTKNVAYLDSAGVPTICTGSTRHVRIGQVASEAECAVRLQEDTSRAGAALKRGVTVPVTQEQYDALLSLVFNIGEGAFMRSTLLVRLNAGRCTEAADEFLRWRYAAGKPLRGLLKRRQAERAMFIQGCYDR